MDPVLDALAVLSLPEKKRKKKRLVKESREEWVEANLDNQNYLKPYLTILNTWFTK